MISYGKFFLTTFVAAALLPAICVAAELRILDSMGLTRAVKYINGSSNVVISAHDGQNPKAEPPDLLLSHVDGLAADIEGTRNADRATMFSDVPEGVWKIKSSEPSVVISEVKIVQ